MTLEQRAPVPSCRTAADTATPERDTQEAPRGDAADLQAVVAAVPGPVLLLDPDAPLFTMRAASDSYLAATMTTREETLGRSVFEVFSDANPANPTRDGVANLRASLETVLRTREPHRMAVQRYDIHRRDGSWEERYWAPLNVPVLGPDGDVRYVLHTVDDVTARHEADLERDRLLAVSETARMQVTAVLESIGDAFYAVDSGFRFTYVNRQAEAFWGRRREDLVGKNFWTEFPQAVGSEAGQLHLQAMVQRRPAHFETISPVIGRWIEVSLYPESGGGLACYFRDISERKAAEAERERLLADAQAARAEAEAANRAKSDFLAVMSHELRTPLNAIGGYAQLIELGVRGPITPEQLEDLRRVQASQRHLLGLINEVLNYAKLETGVVHYDVEPVRMRDVLAGAEALVSPQGRAKGLTLAVAECPPEVVVRADAEKLRQILVNLLSNAVKFTGPGGRVTLACEVIGERLHVTVQDTGIGIEADQIGRIFDPFVQVRSDLTRTAEGTGLGLAISRDLARGMGGDLTVESTPGVGSTFTLTLPVA